MDSITLSVSDIIEYSYCPRFIYFMYCLAIPQFEENRYKVMKGREIHRVKSETNKTYLRQKLGVVQKEINIPLNSEKYHIHGIIDEVLTLQNNTLAPFDYKFSEYKEKNFATHQHQSYAYALLLIENYGLPVKSGYICYTRSNNLVREIEYTETGFANVIKIIDTILKIIQTGYFPKKTHYPNKCVDCCYSNICVK